MNDNLSNAQRLALAVSAMAHFAAAPTPKQKTNVTAAVTEYQEAWIMNRRTAAVREDDPDTIEILEPLNDEEQIAVVLQAVGETLLNRDPELISKMLEFVHAFRGHRGW